MKKIPSVFQRNYETDRLIRDEVVPGCDWVLAGEGLATTKWDGTACMVREGKLYKRYDAKKGKNPPEGWEPCEAEPDEKTGHWPGWLPVDGSNEDRWHREGFDWLKRHTSDCPCDGTYELMGPKIQGNPGRFEEHVLMKHGHPALFNFPRTFGEMKEFLAINPIEGVVFHHPDGRMAKVKARDFGLPWPRRDDAA